MRRRSVYPVRLRERGDQVLTVVEQRWLWWVLRSLGIARMQHT